MQPAIVCGVEAGLRGHFLGLAAPPVLSDHPRADRAPVRLHAFQQHLEPMALSRHVVPEQRRRFVQVDDDNVHVTIVVEIAEGAAAARVGATRSPSPASSINSSKRPSPRFRNTRRGVLNG